eukprot:NODE_1088_length_2256_cov_0.508577.p3 type:complete len:108 gc:universal NODE_1088_length_2256_cov_0.508577:2020-1697(-)
MIFIFSISAATQPNQSNGLSMIATCMVRHASKCYSDKDQTQCKGDAISNCFFSNKVSKIKLPPQALKIVNQCTSTSNRNYQRCLKNGKTTRDCWVSTAYNCLSKYQN